MNRWIASLLVAVVAAAVVAGAAAAAPGGVATAQTDPGTNGSENESGANETANLSPGERLAGVVGVQGAEIDGEVESRAFEVALRESESNETRAGVVADRVNRTEERLAELEQRQRELRERRDAGELSQGAYAARMASTTARIESLSRGLNRTANASASLPAEVREERGVDDERLATLRERADDLRGPEVAAIARSVAGPGVGGPVGADRRGPPGNGTERGPPGNAGPPGNGPSGNGPGNGSAGPPGNGPGNGSAGPPGNGPGSGPAGPPGNGSVGAPGAGSGNGSVGAPGAGSGNGSAGAPGGNGPAEEPGGDGSDAANGSAPSDPAGGNAPDGEPGDGSNGAGSGGSNGAGSGGADGDDTRPAVERVTVLSASAVSGPSPSA